MNKEFIKYSVSNLIIFYYLKHNFIFCCTHSRNKNKKILVLSIGVSSMIFLIFSCLTELMGF